MIMKGMIFTADNVRSIMNGIKTNSRRIIKPQPDGISSDGNPYIQVSHEFVNLEENKIETRSLSKDGYPFIKVLKPRHTPDDIVYVKETLKPSASGVTVYKEDGCPVFYDGESVQWPWPKATSITQGCPEWAARIFLEIINVRAERLQDITAEDVEAEGFQNPNGGQGVNCNWRNEMPWIFEDAWNEMHVKTHPWQSNPWVWRYEFRRCEKWSR